MKLAKTHGIEERLYNSDALYTSSVFDNQKCMSSKLNLCFKSQKEDLQNDLENNCNLLTSLDFSRRSNVGIVGKVISKLNIIQLNPKPSTSSKLAIVRFQDFKIVFRNV